MTKVEWPSTFIPGCQSRPFVSRRAGAHSLRQASCRPEGKPFSPVRPGTQDSLAPRSASATPTFPHTWRVVHSARLLSPCALSWPHADLQSQPFHPEHMTLEAHVHRLASVFRLLAPPVSTGEPGALVLPPRVSSRAPYSSVLAPCVSSRVSYSSVLAACVSSRASYSSVLAPCVSSRAPSPSGPQPPVMSAKDLLRRLARPWRQHLLGQTSLTGDPSRSLCVASCDGGWALWMTRKARGRRSMKPWMTRRARGRRKLAHRLKRRAGGRRSMKPWMTRGARGRRSVVRRLTRRAGGRRNLTRRLTRRARGWRSVVRRLTRGHEDGEARLAG